MTPIFDMETFLIKSRMTLPQDFVALLSTLNEVGKFRHPRDTIPSARLKDSKETESTSSIFHFGFVCSHTTSKGNPRVTCRVIHAEEIRFDALVTPLNVSRSRKTLNGKKDRQERKFLKILLT